ncbi:Neuroligin-2, partial [Leucoagaricus sp. SymC.cos]
NNQTGNFDFFGIRYAAAPIVVSFLVLNLTCHLVGSLRWRAPQIPQTVPGIQKADTHPDTCWQTGAGTQPGTPFPTQNNHQHQKRDAPPSSEDCLFLNEGLPKLMYLHSITTPVSGNGSLPVVVWIHGGGYMGGSAIGFKGDDLVREAGSGVVAVATQYRLGVFGFLSSQKISDGGALNVGLREYSVVFSNKNDS